MELEIRLGLGLGLSNGITKNIKENIAYQIFRHKLLNGLLYNFCLNKNQYIKFFFYLSYSGKKKEAKQRKNLTKKISKSINDIFFLDSKWL